MGIPQLNSMEPPMRIRSALFALALVPGALAFAVTPADTADTTGAEACTTYDDADTPDDTTDDIVTCTETQYLSCEDTIDPAGKVHDFYNSPTIPLTAEEPTSSFTEGAGCGYPEDSFGGATVQNTPFAMDFGDYFMTSVDSVTVEVHDLGPWESAIYEANGNEVELGVRLSIDQQSPLGYEENESVDGTISKSPLTLDVPITVELSETGLSSKYVFTVTNILEDLPGLAKEFGDGSAVFSSVLVTIDFPQTPYPLGSLPSDNVVPVWGASEVPASITVNGPEVGTVIDAREHDVNA
jgi:hypothetical protein